MYKPEPEMSEIETPDIQMSCQHPPLPALEIQTFAVGPLRCNCSIVANPHTKQAVVIDPGGDERLILNHLEAKGYQVQRILHTHAHFDHFLASGKLQAATGATLALHKADKPLWEHLPEQCARFHIPFSPVPPPDEWLEHEEPLCLPKLSMGNEAIGPQIIGKVLHTPGHTPGSVCFLFEQAGVLLAGDTLFKGAIGRTDLWGGSFQDIEQSIRERLYTLDEATTVITGHGEATRIGDELRYNPFVRLDS